MCWEQQQQRLVAAMTKQAANSTTADGGCKRTMLHTSMQHHQQSRRPPNTADARHSSCPKTMLSSGIASGTRAAPAQAAPAVGACSPHAAIMPAHSRCLPALLAPSQVARIAAMCVPAAHSGITWMGGFGFSGAGRGTAVAPCVVAVVLRGADSAVLEAAVTSKR